MTLRALLLIFAIGQLPTLGWALTIGDLDASRNMPGHTIKLKMKPQHARRLYGWIQQIRNVPKGKEFLKAIDKKAYLGLTIEHTHWAVTRGGYQYAEALPKHLDRFREKGRPSVVRMNMNMPDDGTHAVYTRSHELMEFRAVHNLFHEFSHAKHTLSGTMAVMREVQAIQDTNLFRQQEAQKTQETATYRTTDRNQYGHYRCFIKEDGGQPEIFFGGLLKDDKRASKHIAERLIELNEADVELYDTCYPGEVYHCHQNSNGDIFADDFQIYSTEGSSEKSKVVFQRLQDAGFCETEFISATLQ